jgi:hypothetical protein
MLRCFLAILGTHLRTECITPGAEVPALHLEPLVRGHISSIEVISKLLLLQLLRNAPLNLIHLRITQRWAFDGTRKSRGVYHSIRRSPRPRGIVHESRGCSSRGISLDDGLISGGNVRLNMEASAHRLRVHLLILLMSAAWSALIGLELLMHLLAVSAMRESETLLSRALKALEPLTLLICLRRACLEILIVRIMRACMRGQLLLLLMCESAPLLRNTCHALLWEILLWLLWLALALLIRVVRAPFTRTSVSCCRDILWVKRSSQ